MEIDGIDTKSLFANKADNYFMRITNGYMSSSCNMVIANWLMKAVDCIDDFNEDYKNNLSVVANTLRYGK